jgi:myo-inositol 2-dehydrogenase/D-chiro-inositol 1-dehydrogenase
MTVRIGVIGVGVMGAEHARLLTEAISHSELEAVFDIDAERAAAVAATSPGARAFDDPMVLIKDDRVDGVLIASSDQTHEDFVLAAIAAGKHVLCEKPLSPTVEGCARIMRAETEAGRRLVSVGFMRRYDPGYVEMKRTVQSGELGRPLLVHCTHRNASVAPGHPSSMLITGSAVHEIDIARWLLEEELAAVTVYTPRAAAGAVGTQDPLLLILESVSGVVIDVEVFVNAGYGYEVRCELVADHGTILLDSPAATVTRASGSAARTVAADWRPRFAEAYRRELQDWVSGIAADDPVRSASSWDGYVATEVAQVSVRALESRQRQEISLMEKPSLYSPHR